MKKKRNKMCVLCKNFFKNSEMSEEHYPARSAGNEDVVSFDFMKMIDLFMSGETKNYMEKSIKRGETVEQASGRFFDEELSSALYPKGRTARTLCRECNTFLGKYDEAYKKFFDNEGNNEIIKGFQNVTKVQIIKAVYAKFLSIPESKGMEFDYVEFLREENSEMYDGIWNIYCVKRDRTVDMFNFRTLDTGKLVYDEGVVFELSDEKFIFHLMNFPPHEGKVSMNIKDILKKNYNLKSGRDLNNGGYHGEVVITKMFEQFPLI